jgi:hypothetical protein
MRSDWLASSLVALAGLAVPVAAARAESLAPDSKLPDSVAATLRAAFPHATIQKLDVEVEDGVRVYDFEFRDGTVERETDISESGVMLEVTRVIDPSEVPAAAMKAILKAAGRATLGRTERIEVRYDIRSGKLIPRREPATRYASEMAKGNLRAEAIVTAGGRVVEAPEWVRAAPRKPGARSGP